MAKDLFTYVSQIYVLVLEIWMERGRKTLVGEEIDRASFPLHPQSCVLPPPPPSSPEQSRGSFETPRASSSRAIAPFISFISELPFDHQPFTLLPVAVGCRSIFVILENGVSRKETDFTRERALYARLNPIFLFLLLQICRNF